MHSECYENRVSSDGLSTMTTGKVSNVLQQRTLCVALQPHNAKAGIDGSSLLHAAVILQGTSCQWIASSGSVNEIEYF